jgi:hypothetical protein
MSTQILDSLSDIRNTREFKARDENGQLREVLLAEFPTPEDFVRQGRRAIVAEKVRGDAYQSIMDYETVTSLITTRIPVVRR